MSKVAICCMVACLPIWAMAQDTPRGEVEDAQIIIEKDKPLTLPRANRLFQPSEIRPLQQDSVKLTYQVSQPDFELATFSPAIAAKNYEGATEQSSSYASYVRAGFGNYISPLFDAYLSYEQEPFQVGASVFHESFGRGPVRQKESAYGHTSVGLFGTLARDQWHLSPKLDYAREGYYFYGYDQEAYLAGGGNLDDLERRVATHAFRFSAPVRFLTGKSQLSLSPSVNQYLMRQESGTFNRELSWGYQGRARHRLSDQLALQFRSDFSQLTYESDSTYTRNAFRLAPGVLWVQGKWSVDAALQWSVGKDTATRHVVMPDVSAQYLINDRLSVRAMVGGGVFTRSLHEIARQNRYLQDSLTLLNEVQQVRTRLDLSFKTSDRSHVTTYIGYERKEGAGLFVHSPSDTSRFQLFYSKAPLQIMTLGLASGFYVGAQTQVTARMELLTYTLDDLSQAWYLPTLQAAVQGRHTMGPWMFHADVLIQEGITALHPTTLAPFALPAIVNMNLGVVYEIRPNASVTITADNLFATSYERYLYYPSRALTARLGFIYRF